MSVNYVLPQDAEGWSVVPTAGAVIYVNGSAGSDTTGTGAVGAPYATIDHAFGRVDAMPTQTTIFVEDIADSDRITAPAAYDGAPVVVASSSNTSAVAPRVVVDLCPRFYGGRNFALIGVDPYSPAKDFELPGFDIDAQVSLDKASIRNIEGPFINIQIEGCAFRFCEPILQANDALPTGNIILRRSVFYYNWEETNRPSGIYTQNLKQMLIEECIFDHCGWLIQQTTSDPTVRSQGQATYWNHSTYISTCTNTTIRHTTSLRPSSIHYKFTSNATDGTNTIKVEDTTVHDCFFYDGEVIVSAGGNDDFNDGPRWRNIEVSNCVAVEIGTSRPTNRDFAWGIDVDDWDGGRVQGNIVANFVIPGSNVWYFKVNGHSSDVDINNNIFYNPASQDSGGIVEFVGTNLANITFAKNHVQSHHASAYLVYVESAAMLSEITFDRNIYYSPNPTPFRVGTTEYTWAEWVALTGDNGEFTEVTYNAPGRTFADYCSEHGHTLEQAFASIRALSYKSIADSPYNAAPLLDYFRYAFGSIHGYLVPDISVPSAPGSGFRPRRLMARGVALGRLVAARVAAHA